MKLAGPPAMMEVLLLTNSPAPMMPPMEIIVRWRPFSERLSSCLGADCLAEFGWFIVFPWVLASVLWRHPAFGVNSSRFDVDSRVAELRHRRIPPELPLADPGQRIRGVRAVEFPCQPMRIPQGLVELGGRLAIARSKHVL